MLDMTLPPLFLLTPANLGTPITWLNCSRAVFPVVPGQTPTRQPEYPKG
jgi:hypothetical protein